MQVSHERVQLLLFDIYSVFKRVLHCDTFQRPEDASTPLHILKGHRLFIPNRPTTQQAGSPGQYNIYMQTQAAYPEYLSLTTDSTL